MEQRQKLVDDGVSVEDRGSVQSQYSVSKRGGVSPTADRIDALKRRIGSKNSLNLSQKMVEIVTTSSAEKGSVLSRKEADQRSSARQILSQGGVNLEKS